MVASGRLEGCDSERDNGKWMAAREERMVASYQKRVAVSNRKNSSEHGENDSEVSNLSKDGQRMVLNVIVQRQQVGRGSERLQG